MKINKGMTLRTIAGDNILVPNANTILDLNGLFAVTETGAFIWNVLENSKNEGEIVDKLLEEYDIDRKTAEIDVADFLDKLRIYGIID